MGLPNLTSRDAWVGNGFTQQLVAKTQRNLHYLRGTQGAGSLAQEQNQQNLADPAGTTESIRGNHGGGCTVMSSWIGLIDNAGCR